MKLRLLILSCCFIFKIHCQTMVVNIGGKEYKAYMSFESANKVHPDSVEGLYLLSNGFKDFPKDILKYKNIRYLKFGAYTWDEVKDSLSKKQLLEYEKIKEKYPLSYSVRKFYKRNQIKHIPKEIKELKQLEIVDMLSAEIKNKRKFMKIYEYLPNASITPSKEFLEGK